MKNISSTKFLVLDSLIWEHLHLTLTVLLRCLLARSAIILYTECSLNSVFFSILGDLSFAITKLPLVVQKMVSQYEWLYTQISCTDELPFYMQGIVCSKMGKKHPVYNSPFPSLTDWNTEFLTNVAIRMSRHRDSYRILRICIGLPRTCCYLVYYSSYSLVVVVVLIEFTI